MIENQKTVLVVKKIVLVLIGSLLLSCKGVKFVTYQKPMSNLELARYIRLIENRRMMSLENFLYNYRFNYNFNNFRRYYDTTIYNNLNYRKRYTNQTPQSGTVGNTLNTPNVLPPIPKSNIKTKQ